jgi:hypothetical protein
MIELVLGGLLCVLINVHNGTNSKVTTDKHTKDIENHRHKL